MIHTIVQRTDLGVGETEGAGLRHELVVPKHPEIAAELALQGFEGVRA